MCDLGVPKSTLLLAIEFYAAAVVVAAVVVAAAAVVAAAVAAAAVDHCYYCSHNSRTADAEGIRLRHRRDHQVD